MGDLMADTYTYTELANKYGNFMVPSAKILINGKEVFSTLNVGITDISVTLSMNCASSFTFSIAGAYDRKARNFSADVKLNCSLGNIIEVEIGYMSERIKVFKGFISSISVDFNENPSLRITAMDVRKLMMENENREKYYEMPDYSEIVSEVMSAYDDLCTLKQESSKDGLEDNVKQEGSDYSFINRIAELTNKEFLVIGENAYFRKPKSVTKEIITLEYGLSLLSFRRQSNYLNCEIITNSYDKSEQASIYSAVDAKNDDEQKEVLNEAPKIIFVQEDAETEAELKVRAESKARKKKDEANKGGGRCIGMPCLIPGRYIKLDKLDNSYNQKYYIVEVRHTLGEEGFITEFDVEGWE